MAKHLAWFIIGATGAAAAFAQTPVDPGLLGKFHIEAIERSQVQPVFDMLTITIGPRLTASPAHKRAAEWARDRLSSYGLENARLEPGTSDAGGRSKSSLSR